MKRWDNKSVVSVKLDLKPEVEAKLSARARARGLSLDSYLQSLIENLSQAQSLAREAFQQQDIFFDAKTIEQLIAQQGIHPIHDLASLAGALPDEDVDELIADIYRNREARR